MIGRVGRISVVVVFGAAGMVSACSARQERGRGPLHEKNVAIPMRDGVTLRADVLRPEGDRSSRVPTLVYRTPYGKDDALKEYTTFTRAVERGYAVVVQDVRGRYASDGEFRPYEHEGLDGYDTIEWAARQSWSNGKVGTFGLSYPGAVQWLAAVENPPHLEAMVPAMTFSTAQNFFYSGGIWDLSWLYWIWADVAEDARVKRHIPAVDPRGPAGWDAVGDRFVRTLPLDQVRELRDVAPYYFDWLHHPPEDPFWDFAELRHRYGRTRAAVLNLSAWNDDNYGPEGATTNYTGVVESRKGDTSRAALLLGPWTHGVDSTARSKFGERDFGPAATIDYDDVVLNWMDRYLRAESSDGSRGSAESRASDPSTVSSPVRYFVMGDNRWRESKTWPPSGRQVTYYLSSPEKGSHRGALMLGKPGAETPGTIPSDPAKPVVNPYDSAGPHDYRALAERPDVLTFDSPAFGQDAEATGPIRAQMFIACDCRDTDIWVRVLDLLPDGTAFNLMSPGIDALRASYRDISKGRQLLEPGRVYELALTQLVTSNTFKQGHRVRVQISTSFFPNFSRNLHTGDLESISARMQKATVRVYHDAEHPSNITLNIVDR